ncbi:hypothetical protein ES703_82053 [subsurface metagenome]
MREMDRQRGCNESAVPDLGTSSNIRDSDLPEFREYASRKYPELDEDLITMIEDLIERQKQIAPALKPRTIHLVTPEKAQEIGGREIEKKHPHFFED